MKRPAFTLVELLVYLGLTSIALVVFMNFMVGIFANARRADAAQQLTENGRLIVTKITQASRSATGLNDAQSDYVSDLGKVVLTTLTGITTYDIANINPSTGNIRENGTVINTNDVVITKFNPAHIGNTLKITLTIASTAPAGSRPNPLTLVTTLTPRQAIYQ